MQEFYQKNYPVNFLKLLLPRIGLITLSTDLTIEKDFSRICHDQKVNSAGHNWHYIKKINRSGDEINFLEVIQNDNGLVSRINYFIILNNHLLFSYSLYFL